MSEGLNNELIERTTIILSNVEFQNYRWEVRESHGGVWLRAGFLADDNDGGTGAPAYQYTRRWLLAPKMTTSEIVQTAFKCVLTSLEHEGREQFRYRGQPIFGPHFDVNDLVTLARERHTNGARKSS